MTNQILLDCPQFVYAKFELHGVKGKQDTNYQPVAASLSPSLTSNRMEEFKRYVNIGTNVDLDKLDGFVRSIPLIDGTVALVHCLRSPEKAPGRSYYQFFHFIVIEYAQWQLISRALSNALRNDISKTIYRVYPTGINENPQIVELPLMHFELTPQTTTESVVELRFFLENHQKAFFAIINGILERASVTIRRFPEDSNLKIRLLQSIYNILPITLAGELSFATQVFQPLSHSQVRIKFLGTESAIDEDFKNNNYVVDWQQGLANQQTTIAYTTFISSLAEAGEKNLERFISAIADPNEVKESFINPAKRDAGSIQNLRPLALSENLTNYVKSRLGLHFMIENILSGKQRKDLILTLETISTSTEKELGQLDSHRLSELLVLGLNEGLTQQTSLLKTTIKALARCQNIINVDKLCEISPSFSRISHKQVIGFIDVMNSSLPLKASTQLHKFVLDLVKDWTTAPSRLVSDNIAVYLHLWTLNIIDRTRFCEIILTSLEKTPSIELLETYLLQCSPHSPQEFYFHLDNEGILQKIFGQFPHTLDFAIHMGKHVSPISNILVRESANELRSHKKLFLMLLEHSQQEKLSLNLELDFFFLLLSTEIFDVNDLKQIVSVLNLQTSTKTPTTRLDGAFAYLIWRTHVVSGKESLDKYSFVFASQVTPSSEFLDGFAQCALKDKQNQVTAAFRFLFEHVTPNNRLDTIVLLAQKANFNQIPSDLAIDIKNISASQQWETTKPEIIQTLLPMISKDNNFREVRIQMRAASLKRICSALAETKEVPPKVTSDLVEGIIQLREDTQDFSIQKYIKDAVEENDLDKLLFAENFVSVLEQLKKRVDVVTAKNYALFIIKLISPNGMPPALQERYQTFAKAENAPIHLPTRNITHNDLASALTEFRHSDFVQDFSRWNKRAEDTFTKLLIDYWHPRDLMHVHAMLTALQEHELGIGYTQCVKVCLFKSHVDCPREVKFAYFMELLESTAAQLADIRLIVPPIIPETLDNSRKEKLLETIRRLEKYLFTKDSSQEEIPLREILSQIKETLGDNTSRLDRVRQKFNRPRHN